MGHVFFDTKCVGHSPNGFEPLPFFRGQALWGLDHTSVMRPDKPNEVWFDDAAHWLSAYRGLGDTNLVIITPKRIPGVPNQIVAPVITPDVVLEASQYILSDLPTPDILTEILRSGKSDVYGEEEPSKFFFEELSLEYQTLDSEDSWSDSYGHQYTMVVKALSNEGWVYFEVVGKHSSYDPDYIDRVTRVFPSGPSSTIAYQKVC